MQHTIWMLVYSNDMEEWSVQRGVAEGAGPSRTMLEGQWSQEGAIVNMILSVLDSLDWIEPSLD